MSCRQLTIRELVTQLERTTGRKITGIERASVELAPPQYLCEGPGVGEARGTLPTAAPAPKRRRAKRRK
jgi:hypothetical protein